MARHKMLFKAHRVTCDICGGVFTRNNFWRHKQSIRHNDAIYIKKQFREHMSKISALDNIQDG